MEPQKAIVNPVCNARTPKLPPVAIMAATRADLNSLCRILNLDSDGYRPLFISRLYQSRNSSPPFALVGPLIGAPYAAMLLENLVAWGAQQILFLGWCGAVARQINIGDIVLPTAAVIDEGTSRHYFDDRRTLAKPSSRIATVLRSVLNRHKIGYTEGRVWTTDGIYRETVEKVSTHQANAVLAVEMEVSALFSVAEYRGVEVGGLLSVSDDLSSLAWRPGFSDERFKRSRRSVFEAIQYIIVELGINDG
jgi:purine-nucleoside phosphorylase